MTRGLTAQQEHPSPAFADHWAERTDLAAAFRSAARLNLHEGVANHFSVAVNRDGTQFLINPNQSHFSRIRASELLLLDANDPGTMDKPNAPDLRPGGCMVRYTANVLTRALRFTFILFTLPFLPRWRTPLSPPSIRIAQCFLIAMRLMPTSAGLRLRKRLSAAANTLTDPAKKVLIMCNHGIVVLGEDVADAFNRLFYFERAAETYLKALWTGQPLRVLSDEIAERTAKELEAYPGQAERHFSELKAILNAEEPDYAT